MGGGGADSRRSTRSRRRGSEQTRRIRLDRSLVKAVNVPIRLPEHAVEGDCAQVAVRWVPGYPVGVPRRPIHRLDGRGGVPLKAVVAEVPVRINCVGIVPECVGRNVPAANPVAGVIFRVQEQLREATRHDDDVRLNLYPAAVASLWEFLEVAKCAAGCHVRVHGATRECVHGRRPGRV